MKKPTAKIREEIARLQEQLKLAETRDAERIGRIALRAGLGEIEVEEGELVAALEEVAARFRRETKSAHGRKGPATPPNGTGDAAGQSSEG
ncbi:TraC family protein [Rhizobium pusense]|jgi:TraC-like protein|nr:MULTISPECIES: conjugal transfer protein TraC [Hyphomicrobiales]EGP54194.1 putative conjugal transfer protein TraC [Agrobacterium tumefaciens F2]QCM13826.1 TraC family protein [Agrobacterium tumefaciens]KAB2701550.1 TraC family protein [Brucella lupini]MDH0912464.1 TraC family protein [Agrobacterium pusense]MDH1098570.1 TraC family protein [Agrobacterium pusense]